MTHAAQEHQKPAGAKGLPLVGNMVDFARDPVGFVSHLKEEYGDVAAFSLMGAKSVLISDPKDIDRVLQETGKRYSNGKQGVGYALETVLGNGLVRSEGDFWKRQRKLMAPAFHHQSIKQYNDLIVSHTQDMIGTWRGRAELDVHQEMMTLTQRIIMAALFDVDVSETTGQASEAFDAMMHGIGAEMTGIEAVLPKFIPTPSRSRVEKGVHYINDLLLEIIEERRRGGSQKPDLLTMLMDARDDEGQPMSTEQLLDEIRTLYLAGHETTATTLSWTWLLLSRNPHIYEHLMEEVDRVLQGRVPTAEDVPQLSYANAVIKESLRCYPVAWITRRVALEDVQIGGYDIAAGTSVFLSPWVVHHDARWYDAPETFMPERWLREKSALPPREAYLAFGSGPRVCIGNGLAMMESVLIMTTLLQHYRVAILPDHPVAFALDGTLRPKFGLKAEITARNP